MYQSSCSLINQPCCSKQDLYGFIHLSKVMKGLWNACHDFRRECFKNPMNPTLFGNLVFTLFFFI